MPGTFDMVVVGCGGGPSETNLSSYLLKPADQSWQGGIVAVEAGSGVGALKRIMRERPELFQSELSANSTSSSTQPTKRPTAAEVYSYIRGFLVTHGHLDHVTGLVLSAGAMQGVRKRVWATQETLKDLESGVFSDRLWPNLASWKESDPSFMLLYSALPLDKYHSLGCSLSVRTFPISHGSNSLGTCDSAAYFIRHDPSGREMLFWGDVEPDTLAARPSNIRVWREAAPKIVAKQLDAVFIECSWPSGRSDATLFGHLTPEHVVQELKVLATEIVLTRQSQAQASVAASKSPVVSKAGPNKASQARSTPGSTVSGHPSRKLRLPSISGVGVLTRKRKRETVVPLGQLRGVLDGVTVYVIHCKDDLEEKFAEPINEVIAGQIRALVDAPALALGCWVVAVEQGTQISI